jgi:hypothetical protein
MDPEIKLKRENEENQHIISSYLKQNDYSEEFVLDEFQENEIDSKQLRAASRRTVHLTTQNILGPGENQPSPSPGRVRLDSASSIIQSGVDLIEFVQHRLSSLQDYLPIRYYDRSSSNSLNELERLLQKPVVGKYLKYVMKSLDVLVSTPFCYLAKKSDPISLQLAVHYIVNNELTNNIYILHFVDDRKIISANLQYVKELTAHHQQQQSGLENISPMKGIVLDLLKKKTVTRKKKPNEEEPYSFDLSYQLNNEQEEEEEEEDVIGVEASFAVSSTFSTLPHETQELIHNVSILDAFYAYKKIHTVVVRGGFFSPSCLNVVAKYLNIHKNNMIMGVPDEKFPFPFARLNGCRIAVPDADAAIRDQSSAYLRKVIHEIDYHPRVTPTSTMNAAVHMEQQPQKDLDGSLEVSLFHDFDFDKDDEDQAHSSDDHEKEMVHIEMRTKAALAERSPDIIYDV